MLQTPRAPRWRCKACRKKLRINSIMAQSERAAALYRSGLKALTVARRMRVSIASVYAWLELVGQQRRPVGSTEAKMAR